MQTEAPFPPAHALAPNPACATDGPSPRVRGARGRAAARRPWRRPSRVPTPSHLHLLYMRIDSLPPGVLFFAFSLWSRAATSE